MKTNLPSVVITSGEPAGIGPDIILKALSSCHTEIDASLAIVGDIHGLRERAEQLGLPCDFVELADATTGSGAVPVIHIKQPVVSIPGVLEAQNAPHVIACINRAVDLCLSDQFDAMVTAPVHKGIINVAGLPFTGHTEWIANRCGIDLPVMMLANEAMRVCLATTHLPLKAVSNAITSKKLSAIIKTIHNSLQGLYGIQRPVIGVCGLNPHAGEDGHLGDEERRIIGPTIEKLRRSGIHLVGPLPADTAFTKGQLKSVDVVLAMYHDQGLPVIKHNDFGQIVNITLGLPIIRTSVDHGTALDIAGTGDARADSLISAIRLAADFAVIANHPDEAQAPHRP